MRENEGAVLPEEVEDMLVELVVGDTDEETDDEWYAHGAIRELWDWTLFGSAFSFSLCNVPMPGSSEEGASH